VVVSQTWPYRIIRGSFDLVRRPLPEGLFKEGRKYVTVYIDNHDGHRTVSWEPEYRQFDLILRSKLNRRAWSPENLHPWAYGLNNRILDATYGAPPFGERRKTLLVNFGASHPFPHGTRDLACVRFEPKIEKFLSLDKTKDNLRDEPSDPYDTLMWRQTEQRFSRAYYERLKQSQAVACFCGELIPPMPFRNPECYLVGGNRAKLRRLIYELLSYIDPRPRRSVQWDSFRFWESLAAGCASFNVDLDLYGVELPVMPVNWTHYIGIDFGHINNCIDRLLDDPNILAYVAEQGYHWAREFYSPRRSAERFLQLNR
jgi:hypothetical protein